MEHVSNEEKAKDITKCLWFPQKCTEEDIQNMLMQMAEWKDEEHAKEKQQWIDEAAVYISTHTLTTMSMVDIHNMIIDFKRAMKGE